MFGFNTNRKKASKEKKAETSPKYQEDFNEVILNDLVPEERKSEFGLEEARENNNGKKSKGLKLNLGANNNNKKSNPKSKKQQEASSEAQEKTTKKTKQSKKVNKEVADNDTGSKKVKSKKPMKKTKQSKKGNASPSTSEDIINPPTMKQPKKEAKSKEMPQKKKKVKQMNKKEDDVKINNVIEPDFEQNESYVTQDNFDSINFRNPQEVEVVEVDCIEEKKHTKHENSKKRFENLVWSEEKFPKN